METILYISMPILCSGIESFDILVYGVVNAYYTIRTTRMHCLNLFENKKMCIFLVTFVLQAFYVLVSTKNLYANDSERL